nr:TetR/AcrR family transcriptional regulator [Nocardiopsis ansamitocini]
MNTSSDDVSVTHGDENRAGPAATGQRGHGRRQSGSAPLVSQRRDSLVRLAAELFARKGFQATTVREIADKAGILSGSLYHHFDSKESIVDEILSSYLEELLRDYRAAIAAGGTSRELLARLITVAYASIEPHRAAITVVQNDWQYLRQFPRFAYLDRSEKEIEELWLDVIVAGRASGAFREGADAKLTYRMIRDTIWVTVRWYRPDGPLGTSDLAAHFMTVLFDGIGTDGQPGAPSL